MLVIFLPLFVWECLKTDVFLLSVPLQIITVNAMLFPSSVANSLIAVGTDGLQERDRMVRAAIAIVCELGEYLAF